MGPYPALAIAGAACYLCQNEIKDFTKSTGKYIYTCCTRGIIIEDFESINSIKEELRIEYVYKSHLMVLENGAEELRIPNGRYWIFSKEEGLIFFELEKDSLTIFTHWFNTLENLEKYTNRIKKKYSQEHLTFYLSRGDKWGFPKYRRDENIDAVNMTPEMKIVLEDFEEFRASETDKDRVGSYKRAYLLTGPSGTGKTLTIRYLATKYKRAIYRMSMSKDMSDSDFLELLSDVPPESIIEIDELDKQLERMGSNNKKNNLTPASMLSGIDGSMSLGHGVVIILVANNNAFLDTQFGKELTREGRIDKIVEFKTKGAHIHKD